ncbi:hypothetical protein DNL40_16010 [Xylanimonas oleitrophica]|uniref:DUF3817 domain-containing protein n=1 Tax=Xylanimonas oleitrophica TaxID=2607479 RepID=A0A2W5WKD3_9MICO|nr:DUF3817 domain-containing protein [Xylanimonas oleitrophica]PZR51522.1 hypothetical protein DNL40_16010 [Xylanimonas oleitrophica]
MAAAPIDRTGRLYAVVAFAEAASWAGLLVGMFLKYVTQTTEVGVQVFGAIHGALFIVYVAVTIFAAVRLRWSWKVALVALAASVPPLTTVPMEMWLRRTGRLSARTTP